MIDLLESPPEHISKILYGDDEPEGETEKPGTPEVANENHNVIPDPVETVEDIKKAELVSRNIVNKYGRAPAKGEKDLHWKNEKKPLSGEEVAKYEKFAKFMEVQGKVLKSVQDKTGKIARKLEEELHANKGKPNQEAMEDKLERETTALLDVLLEESNALGKSIGATEKGGQALFLYTLGIENLPGAYDKLSNVIQLEMVPSVRKGKEVFKEVHEDGKQKTEKLSDFLGKPEHMGYGDQMVENTHEVLLKVYRGLGKELGLDLSQCRDVLIGVIKTRGGAPIKIGEKTVSEVDAKKIYTAFLVMKESHLGEKEALQLLIAFREKPPFVYDLRNTGSGWAITGSKKEGIGVLEDFCLDGMIYNELRQKLGMTKVAFNGFIQRVAPQFETLRSVIQQGGTPPEGFTPEDIKKFKELMAIPLWVDKVGHAYKHAIYDSEEREVPMIDKLQGPDTKKLDVIFVNIEEKLSRIAERLADERLDQELKERGPQGWKQLWRLDKIISKFWMRNAAVAYREKYIEEFKKRLKEDPKYRTELMQLNRPEVKGTDKIPAEGVRENLNGELDAIAERFGIALHGDRNAFLTNNETIEDVTTQQIQASIKNLCQSYARGAIDDAQFRQGMKPIIQQIQAAKGTNDEIIGFLEETQDRGSTDPATMEKKEGLLDKLKAHRAGLIALDLDNMRIHLGTAKNVDVKTQAKDLNWSDSTSRKMVESLQRNKVLGRFVNPATLGIMGFGLANITASIATSKTLRWSAFALAPFGGPAMWAIAAGCLTGGVFSAVRKNKETLYHKAQKERRDALDYRPDNDQKGLNPNQPDAKRFERRMESTLYTKVLATDLTNDIQNAITANDYNALSVALGKAIALNTISENDRIDLIKFDGEMKVEEQRLALVRAIDAGKRAMRSLATGRDYIMDLQQSTANEETQVRSDMGTAEGKFQKFKRGENWKAAGIGAAFGAGASAALTGIGHLAGWTDGHVNTAATKNLTEHGPLSKGDMLRTLKVAGLSQQEVNRLAFDAHGKPTAATLDFLRSKNISIQEIVQPPVTTTQSVQHIINGGGQMKSADLIREMRARGVNFGQGDLDAQGHITQGGLAKIHAAKIQIHEVSTSSIAPINGGAQMTSAQLIQEMNTRGVGVTAGDFDAQGRLTSAGLLKAQNAGIQVHEATVSTTITGAPVITTTPVAGGMQMPSSQFITEMQARGVTLTGSDFDAQGHLTSAALGRIHAAGINVQEHVVVGPVTGSKIDALRQDGFERIKGIHFNGHRPKHILDELRVHWIGKPEIRPDGYCHFSMRDMVNRNLTHTRMPSGVTIPSDPTKFKAGLEVKVNGKIMWKFFTPDSNGEIKIPKEYFDGNVGRVRGAVMPGLKTYGIATGFDDKNGTYQVLASVRGKNDYMPTQTHEVQFSGQHTTTEFTGKKVVDSTAFTAAEKKTTFEFTGEQTLQKKLTESGEVLYTATQEVTEKVGDYMAVAPIVASPMSHLEYGEKKKPQPQPPEPPPVTPEPPPVTPEPPNDGPNYDDDVDYDDEDDIDYDDPDKDKDPDKGGDYDDAEPEPQPEPGYEEEPLYEDVEAHRKDPEIIESINRPGEEGKNKENGEGRDKILRGFQKLYASLAQIDRAEGQKPEIDDEEFTRVFSEAFMLAHNFSLRSIEALAQQRGIETEKFIKKLTENLKKMRDIMEYYYSNLEKNDPIALGIKDSLEDAGITVHEAFSAANMLLRNITSAVTPKDKEEDWRISVDAPKPLKVDVGPTAKKGAKSRDTDYDVDVNYAPKEAAEDYKGADKGVEQGKLEVDYDDREAL
ncbi:MAG: hypothetical protein AAB551_02640 [Patescibacteria group bacterium]